MESINSLDATLILPFPWMTHDIGAAGVAGSASFSFSNSVFTLTGSGADIWNAADAFRFVYMTNSGSNCTIVARVVTLQDVDPWSKAGVMIRDSTNANAANAFIAVTPGNGMTWQYRPSDGGSSYNYATAGLSAPYWVKLVRSGSAFTGYRSPDGTNWTQQGTETFTMSNTAYAGLALTSHNNSTLCMATFDNVTAPGWPVSQGLAPTGLSATPVSASQINLAWNALTNGAAYNVKRSTTNGGPYTIVASGVTATNYSDVGLAGGTIYYYVVSAVISGSETPNSAQATATTVSGALGSLVHRYSSSETSGNIVADSVGGPVWNGVLPNGGTLTNGMLLLSPVSQQYANLPGGIVSSLSNITVMAWVNLSSNANWNRIFDFGNNTTTYMFLTPQNGATGTLRFAITTNSNGAEQQINCSSALSTNTWHQVAVSLSSGKGVLYLDGTAVGTNSSMTLNPTSLGITTNNYIGRSQWPADPYLDGLMNEFRIYNAGLSAAEMAATAAMGANQQLSTNSPLMDMALAGTNLTLTWPLANADYTLQSSTNLAAGNWKSVISPAPQIIGGQWQVTLPPPGNAVAAYYRLVK